MYDIFLVSNYNRLIEIMFMYYMTLTENEFL